VILEMLAWLAFLVIGARLAIVDIAEHRLPNRLVILLAASSTALLAGASLVSADPGRFMRAMGCGMLVFCTMFVLAVLVPSGLGMGDVKLGFVTGMFLGWIGWEWAYWGTFIGFACGALWALSLVIRRRGSWSTAIAFGPCMLLGVVVCAVGTAV
jgi:leader peptidase (prepilin peptidase)/N-methyltransferase